MSTDQLTHPLTVAERDTLAECEGKIERGMQTFLEVGNALTTIRDSRLYRAEFATFEDYCVDRWSISRPRAYELMAAAQVVSAIADKIAVPPPGNEGQARELAKVHEDERADVWQETVERTDGKPTAAAIRQTRQEREQPTEAALEPDELIPAADTAQPQPSQADGDERPDELEAPEASAPVVPRSAPPVPPAFQPPPDHLSDEPDVIERERRVRASEGFSRAVGSLWNLLDPNPIEFVTDTWLADEAGIDYEVHPELFKPDGLRGVAGLLVSIADHLESTGRQL